MGRFKEQKKQLIEQGKEQGDAGIRQGEQRVRELQQVKGMIDSLEFEDEADLQQIQMLKEQYREAGIAAHRQEVDSAVKSARQGLETNKQDIHAERGNVERSAKRAGEMKGVSDVGRAAAAAAERNFEQSAGEYGDMEKRTEDIETRQEQSSQDILRRIETMF